METSIMCSGCAKPVRNHRVEITEWQHVITAYESGIPTRGVDKAIFAGIFCSVECLHKHLSETRLAGE